MNTILKVDDINVYYGAIHAIKGVSFEVNEGEVVTLIGANGAGKSTILKTVAGLLSSRTGSVQFMGKDLGGIPAHKIVPMGLALVPEGRQIFLQMTVEENLQMGAFTRPASEYDESVRRRTADAGHGPRPDVQAPPADAGRALHGSGPHPGGADL